MSETTPLKIAEPVKTEPTEKIAESRTPSRGSVASAAGLLVGRLFELTRRPATDQETMAAVRKYAPVIMSLAQLDDPSPKQPSAEDAEA